MLKNKLQTISIEVRCDRRYIEVNPERYFKEIQYIMESIRRMEDQSYFAYSELVSMLLEMSYVGLELLDYLES